MATATNETSRENQFSTASSKTSFDLEPNPFEQSFAHKDEKTAPNIGSATSPQILTPGGRKLPPLVLSPNVPSSWGNTQFPRTGLTPNESSMRTGLTPGGANFPHSLNNMALSGLNTPGGLGFSGFTPGLSSLLGTNTKDFVQQAQANATNATNAVVHATDAPTVRNGSNQQPAPQPASQPPQINVQAPQSSNGTNGPPAQSHTPHQQPRVEQGPISPPKSSKRKGSVSNKKQEQEGKRKKPKAQPKQEELKDEMLDDDIDTEGMTEEEKRRSFLERNRVAASKCRQRKKQQIQKMEADLNFYLNEYNNLTATVDSLKENSLLLRNLITSKVNSPEIVGSVDNLLAIINQTNYMSRLRGDNPSNVIPTVQPINPTLVQQSQQRAAVAASGAVPQQVAVPIQAIPPQAGAQMGAIQQQQALPLQNVPQGQMSMTGQMPIAAGNGTGKAMMDWVQGA